MADPVAATPAGSIFDDHAPLYRAAGYRVVPIAPGTKYPGVHQGFGSFIALVGWPTSHVIDPQPGLAGREANPTVVDFEAAQPSSEPEPQQPRGYRFKLVAFNDMKPGLEQLYLVDELIPIAGLVDIWGKPKCFKSFWTLDVMFHVAMGWEYRDRSV